MKSRRQRTGSRKTPHRGARNHRPAALGSGRLSNIQLPAQAKPGEPHMVEVEGKPSLVLVEGSDIKAWDLLCPTPEPLPQLLRQRVMQAHQKRQMLLPPHTNIYRAVHDAADGLPGVVADVYGRTVLCQSYGQAYRHHARSLAHYFLSLNWSVRFVERQKSGGKVGEFDRWFGQPVENCIVVEEGISFRVRLNTDFLGTGLFADQRPQRQRVRELARGRRVLNLFGYAGGFTVAAAVGGAAAVDHVDLSRQCLSWAAENIALNGLSPRRYRFIGEDARTLVKKARRRGWNYDLIVVDPPTFALGSQPFRLQRDLGPLVAACSHLLKPNGLLMVSVNDRGTRQSDLISWVHQNSAGQFTLLGAGGQGWDYPIAASEGLLQHLKVLWLQKS